MRLQPVLLITALLTATLAGCTDDPTPDAADVPEVTSAAFIHGAGQVALELASIVDGALLAAEGTYYEIGGSTFEPTLGITSSGTILMTGNLGVANDGLGTNILRSRDQGQTWDDATPRIAGFEQVPSSNDPYIYVDPWTDRVIKFDMHALACMTLETSDDEGDSWSVVTPACGQPIGGLQDHQSITSAPPTMVPTVAYDNVLVYCVNRGPGAIGSWCSSSFDGGINWTPLVPGYPVGTSQCIGGHGHLAGAADGSFYRPGYGCNGATIWRSDDSGITWSEHPVAPDVGMGAGGPTAHEAAVAIDEGGNVYAFWIGGDDLPYLAASTDKGETWGAAHQVAAPGLTATSFPTIAAAANGSVAFAYIGTSQENGYEGNSDEMTWHGFIGTTTMALNETPVFATVAVNDLENPLHIGPCGDRRCGGFGDFIDIGIDPEGRPWAAMAWDNLEEVDNGAFITSEGEVRGIVATLASGPSLNGNGTALPALPLGGPSDE